MRPLFDPRFFPGLPKFLWFDDGGGDSGGPGSGDAGTGSNAGPGTGNTSGGPGGIGSDAAASGDEGGPADSPGGTSVSVAPSTAPSTGLEGFSVAGVNAPGPSVTSPAAAAFGGGIGGPGSPGAGPAGGIGTGVSGIGGPGSSAATGGVNGGTSPSGSSPGNQAAMGLAALLGLGPNGLLGGLNSAAPVGNVSTAPVSSPSALFSNPAALAQMRTGLAALAGQAAAQGFGFSGRGGIGSDTNAGQGVSTFGDMSDARGFGGTQGVGDPGAAGSSAVGTPSPAVTSPAAIAAGSPTSPNAVAKQTATQGATNTALAGLGPPGSVAGTGQSTVSPSPTAPPTTPLGLSPVDISGILQALLGVISERPNLSSLAQNNAMGLG